MARIPTEAPVRIAAKVECVAARYAAWPWGLTPAFIVFHYERYRTEIVPAQVRLLCTGKPGNWLGEVFHAATPDREYSYNLRWPRMAARLAAQNLLYEALVTTRRLEEFQFLGRGFTPSDCQPVHGRYKVPADDPLRKLLVALGIPQHGAELPVRRHRGHPRLADRPRDCGLG